MKQIQRSLLVHHPRAVVAAGWVVLWLAVTTGTAGADVSGTAEEFDGEPPRRAGLLGRTTTGGVGGGNHHHLRRSPTPKFLAGDLAGPAAAARGGRPEPPQQRQQRCRNLSEILCETAIFESFCELLNDSGAYDDLAEDFSGPSWTVFAPTNTALEGELLFLLGDDNDRYSNDTDAGGLRDDRVMTDFLGFHVIRDELVAGSDLACNDTLVMSNGGSTRVVCNIHEGDEGAVYLVGNGNTNDEHPPPRIVVADVIACNGVIHVLDNVLIDGGEAAGGDDPVEESEEPVPAAPECRSIQEAVCGVEELSYMCAFLEDEALGLLGVYDDGGGGEDTDGASWTVFAPTNDAFDSVQDILDGLDPDTVEDILRFHVIPGVIAAPDELRCGTAWRMGNGETSTTTCSEFSGDTYQVGPGNTGLRKPRIVATDLNACRGVVHTVDSLLMPGL